jgi:hypothetical protein
MEQIRIILLRNRRVRSLEPRIVLLDGLHGIARH